MGTLKTQPTDVAVTTFLQSVEHKTRQQDANVLLETFARITGEPAVMWGPSIIGFGEYEYQTANKKTEHFLRSGFSPRKQNLSLYLMAGISTDEGKALLDKLGKHKTGVGCLYINKLADVDLDILEQLIALDLGVMNERYPQ